MSSELSGGDAGTRVPGTDPERCEACSHLLTAHFASVTGAVRCLVSESGVSSSGVIGLPWSHACDCTDYASPETARRRQSEAEEKAEENRWADELTARIREAMKKNPPPIAAAPSTGAPDHE